MMRWLVLLLFCTQVQAKPLSFVNPPRSEVAKDPSELASLQFVCNLKTFQSSRDLMRKCAKNGIVPESEKKKWDWHKEVVCEPNDPKKCKTVYSN